MKGNAVGGIAELELGRKEEWQKVKILLIWEFSEGEIGWILKE